MEPLFKVGDQVRVLKRVYASTAYRDRFVDKMAMLAGKIYTIHCCKLSSLPPREIHDDGYFYCLKEDHCKWPWNSSMLEKVEEENHFEETQPKENNDSVLKIKLKTKNKIKLNFNN